MPAQTEDSSGSVLCVCTQGLQNRAQEALLEGQARDSTPGSFELDAQATMQMA